MKIRKIVLFAITLVVIDQVIKLVISANYRDVNIEIIPSLLEFKPTLNNKSFYWFAIMGIDVGRWSRLLVGFFGLSLLSLLHYQMRKKIKNAKWWDAGFTFGFAGILCSMCDNIFFGGSWDFIYLKPLFIFDMKDLYLNCFVILILVSSYKNKEKLKT